VDIDTRLVNLLVQYEDLKAQGHPVEPEVLCRDCHVDTQPPLSLVANTDQRTDPM
jgi:hypothetical protein